MTTVMQEEDVVPKAVREQEQQAEREAAEQGNGIQAVDPNAGDGSVSPELPVANAQASAEGSPVLSIEEQFAASQRQLKLERQRNSTLKGMLEAEGPRQAGIIKELKAEITKLAIDMNAVREARTPTVPSHLKYLKPEERGADLSRDDALGISGRATLGVMEDMVSEKLAAIGNELRQLKERQEVEGENVARRMAKAKSNEFFQAVEKLEPGSLVLDQDENFKSWLSSVDEDNLEGKTFRELAIAAFAVGDVRSVANIYRQYKQQAGITDRTPDSQIRPEKAHGARPVSIGKKRTYRLSDINKFAEDYTKGRFEGREKEAEKLQEEYAEAEREGRIDMSS